MQPEKFQYRAHARAAAVQRWERPVGCRGAPRGGRPTMTRPMAAPIRAHEEVDGSARQPPAPATGVSTSVWRASWTAHGDAPDACIVRAASLRKVDHSLGDTHTIWVADACRLVAGGGAPPGGVPPPPPPPPPAAAPATVGGAPPPPPPTAAGASATATAAAAAAASPILAAPDGGAAAPPTAAAAAATTANAARVAGNGTRRRERHASLGTARVAGNGTALKKKNTYVLFDAGQGGRSLMHLRARCCHGCGCWS